MKKISKILTVAAAAAMVTIGAAAPAEAQYRRHYYDRDRGIDAGDVIAGVAIVGGIAAIASAVSNSNRNRYGYSYGGYAPAYGYGHSPAYGYGGHYGAQGAVSACTYEAQRYGRVSITDVDQRNARRYRVHGVIDNGGYYNRGYGRTGFTCTAREDGRVTNFRTSRY